MFFHDSATTYPQRYGEMIIELSIFVIVVIFQGILLVKLYKRIPVPEGYLPICANCKKNRNAEEQREKDEQYITENSLARFSHGSCPERAHKLYHDLYPDIIRKDK